VPVHGAVVPVGHSDHPSWIAAVGLHRPHREAPSALRFPGPDPVPSCGTPMGVEAAEAEEVARATITTAVTRGVVG